MIAYQIHPVLSYEHIANCNDNTLQTRIREGELHTIIMINCGAIVDLNHMLFVRPLLQRYYSEKQQREVNKRRNIQDSDDEDQDIDLDEEEQQNEQQAIDEYVDNNLPEKDPNFKIYVIDSHRPFNLKNVYDDEKVKYILYLYSVNKIIYKIYNE